MGLLDGSTHVIPVEGSAPQVIAGHASTRRKKKREIRERRQH